MVTHGRLDLQAQSVQVLKAEMETSLSEESVLPVGRKKNHHVPGTSSSLPPTHAHAPIALYLSIAEHCWLPERAATTHATAAEKLYY